MISSFLDRWDEARAAEDDGTKVVERVSSGASLAFGEAMEEVGLRALQRIALQRCESSDEFYSSPRPSRKDFDFKGELLTFPSAISTETPANDLVYARVVEVTRRRVAIIILPHWNAPIWSYHEFTKHFSRFGFTSVELALPYHGLRARNGQSISDYFLSANLGRTIRSVRQAVIDTRDVITWLNQRGYDRIVLVGLSLGSCVAGLTAAHDRRIACSVLVLSAGDFAEVVWTGRATQHIRRALEREMTLDQLSSVWSIISTGTFAEGLSRSDHNALIVSGARDTVVKPYLTQRFVDLLRSHDAKVQWMKLACGHYSIALPPFNIATFVRLMCFFKSCGLFR